MCILGLQCDLHDALVEIVLLLVLWIREIPPCNHISSSASVERQPSVVPVARNSLCFFLPVPWMETSVLLHGLLIFFIIWINEENSSQLSSIVIQYRLFHCPFLFFSILCGFSISGPYLRPHAIWSCGCLNFCQFLSQTTYSVWKGFSFNNVNFVKPFHKSDKLLFKSTFQ